MPALKFGGMEHFYRNIFSHVPSGKVRDVTHMLKAIHALKRAERPLKRKPTLLLRTFVADG